MNQTTLFLARHADVHNPESVLYGRLPRFRLSKLGRDQADLLADHLAAEKIVAIYTSPMLRARQTAQAIVARHPGIPVQINSAFMEINSAYQGTPISDMERIRFNYYETPKHPDDETIANIWARVRRGIETLRRRHTGQSFVAVSHGDPIKIAWLSYLDKPLTFENIRESPYPARASVLRLNWVDGSEQPEVSYTSPAGGGASA